MREGRKGRGKSGLLTIKKTRIGGDRLHSTRGKRKSLKRAVFIFSREKSVERFLPSLRKGKGKGKFVSRV